MKLNEKNLDNNHIKFKNMLECWLRASDKILRHWVIAF